MIRLGYVLFHAAVLFCFMVSAILSRLPWFVDCTGSANCYLSYLCFGDFEQGTVEPLSFSFSAILKGLAPNALN